LSNDALCASTRRSSVATAIMVFNTGLFAAATRAATSLGLVMVIPSGRCFSFFFDEEESVSAMALVRPCIVLARRRSVIVSSRPVSREVVGTPGNCGRGSTPSTRITIANRSADALISASRSPFACADLFFFFLAFFLPVAAPPPSSSSEESLLLRLRLTLTTRLSSFISVRRGATSAMRLANKPAGGGGLNQREYDGRPKSTRTWCKDGVSATT
jgi:hypothetical protein